MAGWRALTVALLAAGALAVTGCFQRMGRAPDPPAPTAAIAVTQVVSPGPTATPAPAPVAPATTTPEVSPTTGAVPVATAVSTPLPATTPVSSDVQRYGLFVEIEGLNEDSVVRGDTVVARGRTRPDAVLSINGVIVPVDAIGSFEVLLTLDPGPNIIEVVASDLEGNEETRVLAVVSLPGKGP